MQQGADSGGHGVSINWGYGFRVWELIRTGLVVDGGGCDWFLGLIEVDLDSRLVTLTGFTRHELVASGFDGCDSAMAVGLCSGLVRVSCWIQFLFDLGFGFLGSTGVGLCSGLIPRWWSFDTGVRPGAWTRPAVVVGIESVSGFGGCAFSPWVWWLGHGAN